MLILKRFFTIFFSLILFLSSCSQKPAISSYGIKNLNIIEKSIKINFSNKNDIVSELGETILKEYPDDNTWIYIETEIDRNFFGQKKIKKNNMLILKFDNRGILVAKSLLDLNSMKDLKVAEEKTISLGVNDSFSKKIFSSMRKRFFSRQKNADLK